MSELRPAPFSELVTRMYAEAERDDAVFHLPRSKWFLPSADAPDFSVLLHGTRVGNPAGPAAGPHTQMAQNLLLAYAAGARILELKTVQINDRLTIPRPCIDMTTIGYNVEWSQELRLEESLREYVAGAMLIEMFRDDPVFSRGALEGTTGAYALDMSVGYDLAGIRSEKIHRFLDGLRDASVIVEELARQIPARYSVARALKYPTGLSHSVTLSTFHGCPAEEIERIAEHLLTQKDLDVVVKMNPPMLGRERLEHLLHEVMGYTDLRVAPQAYDSGLQFADAVQLVGRLSRLAASVGRHFGCKFSNTLEVLNHRSFFSPDNKMQYLSGQPLHVITMALTALFRDAVGPAVPISFSAGIDRHNFAPAVACGFVPVSVCSDLLRPGGYGRIGGYLAALAEAMKAVGARTIPDFIHSFALANGFSGEPAAAAIRNTHRVAAEAEANPRYFAAQNGKAPKRLASHLSTFDCLTCDKCITVCPNAANFAYPSTKAAYDAPELLVQPDGSFSVLPGRPFRITKDAQIANLGDFCNDCGNCDTFCPELGGPYLQKPRVMSSYDSFEASAPRDACLLSPDGNSLTARLSGVRYILTMGADQTTCTFSTPEVELTLRTWDHAPVRATWRGASPASPARVDLWFYHALRQLMQGLRSVAHAPALQ